VSTTLFLTDVISGAAHAVPVERLVVAGFTGRDSAKVATHVEELRELGVPVPATTPSFYVLRPELLTTLGELRVDGAFTSGEVEPVVVMRGDGEDWLLAVCSDHTDRDVEADDIGQSKAVCPKPISASVLPLGRISDWDAVRISSRADGTEYQGGSLADLLPLEDILAAAERADVELGPRTVLYLGTVPVVGGLRPASRFEATLQAGEHRLELTYEISPSEQGT
jgi:2-keto-4-pentenoate hydratase/2-oxohepta-3-ene-1,7-dioic acid hydratase in catechol pathway